MWTKLRLIQYIYHLFQVYRLHIKVLGAYVAIMFFFFFFVEILESCLHNSGQEKRKRSKRPKRFLNDETAKLKKEHCDCSITTTECYMINDDTLCMVYVYADVDCNPLEKRNIESNIFSTVCMILVTICRCKCSVLASKTKYRWYVPYMCILF